MAATGRNGEKPRAIPLPHGRGSFSAFVALRAARVSKWYLPLFLLFAVLGVAAEPPEDVVKVFRTLAESLAEQDAGLFFEQFDAAMPGFAQMREDVEGLLIKGYVISTLEFEADSGDTNSRQVEVDWLWHLSGEAQHRVLLKCTLVRKGKAWKITALTPADFLHP